MKEATYVLPRQCEQLFYCEVQSRGGWSFVVTHNPRRMRVKYNVGDDNEEGLEEEDNVEDDQHDSENP